MSFLFFLVFGILSVLGAVHLTLGILCSETIFIVSGSVCLGIALLVLFFFLRSRFRAWKLKKYGRKVWALVTGWEEDDKEAAEQARQESSDFLVTFTLEAEGKTYTCLESTSDPDSFMNRTVPIYFSAKNPKRYRIEFSEIR